MKTVTICITNYQSGDTIAWIRLIEGNERAMHRKGMARLLVCDP